MYIPKLRKINQIINEIREQDADSTLTFAFIRELVKNNHITCMKYGNAWLVNADELYKYFGGKRTEEANPDFKITKRLYSSGDIYRLFKENDEHTIIRRPNCRQFCLDNNIFMDIHEKAWLIDFAPFMKALNPKKIQYHYELPRMRNIQQCVKLWNNTHRRQGKMIDKHMVERFVGDDRVFTCKYKRTIINYDQLAPLIENYIDTTGYRIKRIKR